MGTEVDRPPDQGHTQGVYIYDDTHIHYFRREGVTLPPTKSRTGTSLKLRVGFIFTCSYS